MSQPERHMPQGQDQPARLRRLLASGPVAIPGAFNPLTAMQIEQAGFEALYVSGAALSAARGLPDIGLIPLRVMVREAGAIAKAVGIPVLVDADTGYGAPALVKRAVRAFMRIGLAGMQIEDQEDDKRCGHLPGKRLVPAAEMAAKIRAAVEARGESAFMIVARTDARAVEGLEAAIHRAQAYAEAEADALFPEALQSAEEFSAFAQRMAQKGIRLPLIANMTEFGKSPYLNIGEFGALGYHGILFPVSTLRVATRAVAQLLADLKTDGTQQGWVERMMPRQELYRLLRYDPAQDQRGRPHERHDVTGSHR
ncbi:MAG: 2-methylisocitrate lyase [Nitrospirae bacterium]|nr:2-methylisocitrate lyase [Nitrospirota bacterium]MEB2340079.1 isocitrate lyase/phosphoenolpyruvate mutase family protein [Nitrospirales bacterium]